MKKLITLFAIMLTGTVCTVAQSQVNTLLPLEEEATNLVIKPNSLPQVAALFDPLFNLSLDTITGNNGKAAITFLNGEYWVSRWSNDSIYTIDLAGNLTGSFTITGVGTASSGVRAFTTDGTNIYAAVNTNSIKRIDPVNKVLLGTISCASTGITARSLTYDATANGGAGGFWISNFTTDIFQISMTGTILQSIPASGHTLTGMYGTAVDNVSPGGPFLWIFDQGYSVEQSDIVQLNIAQGMPTGVAYDVYTNLGIPAGDTSGLAGGIFLSTSSSINTTGALLAVLQGSPSNRFIGLDLDVTVGVNDYNSENDNFLHLYPNPSEDFITVEFENYSKGNYDVEVLDVVGKTVQVIAGVEDEYFRLDVTKFEKGIYTLKVSGNHKVSIKKFVVE